MQGRTGRIALIVIFVGLITTVAALNRMSARRGMSAAPVNSEAAMAHYGFRLEEVSKSSGIDFVHVGPKLDPKLDHIMPQVAAMGASVSIVDFDRDGWQDIYVCNSGEGTKNRLYRNLGDGQFRDVAEQMGLADLNQPGTGCCIGAIWGDFDNDGYEDLFIYKYGRMELFRNEQGKRFTRTTDQAGFPAWANVNAAVWLDYDRDGRLDLFVGGYFHEDVNLWNLKTTRMMPESFEYAKNGGRKYLFRNLGDGRFQDVTAEAGIDSRRWALAACAADLRGTGYPDIFIANDYGVSELFINEGGKRFREVGKASGVGFAPKSGMNAAVGDILNQGRFAIYVSNISQEGILIQGNNLWVPRESKPGEIPRYENMARDTGVELGGWSFGAQFGDLNNDGNLDLYLVNGYVSADPNRDYWYEFSKIALGNSAIIGDAKNWPPMEGRSLSGYQSKKVWINDGAGRFTEVAAIVGVQDKYDGRSVVLADLWNRGVLDAVVANQRGPLLVYKNHASSEKNWIGFRLEATVSNRSAIGAQVRVFWNGQQQVQEVSGGSGFCGQNMRPLHFGLGKDPKIEKVVIRWPSGKTQTLTGLEIGKYHSVKEPS